MADLVRVIWDALAAVPWWFWLFALVAVSYKPVVRQAKRFWGGGF